MTSSPGVSHPPVALRRPLMYGTLLAAVVLAMVVRGAIAAVVRGDMRTGLFAVPDVAIKCVEFTLAFGLGWWIPVWRRPTAWEGALCVAGLALALAVQPMVFAVTGLMPGWTTQYWIGTMPFHLAGLVVFVGLGRMAHRLRDRQMERLALASLEARLATLRAEAFRARLRPPFVLDCIDLISARMETDPPAADAMVIRLSDLLRLTLERIRAERLSISRERQFLESYVALVNEIRGEVGRIRVDVPAGAQHALVPSAAFSDILEQLHARCGAGARDCDIHVAVQLRGDDVEASASCRTHGPDVHGASEREYPLVVRYPLELPGHAGAPVTPSAAEVP